MFHSKIRKQRRYTWSSNKKQLFDKYSEITVGAQMNNCLTFQQANALKVGDKIDLKHNKGKFLPFVVIQKTGLEGTTLYFRPTCDLEHREKIINYRIRDSRLKMFKFGSISAQKIERLQHLKKNDEIQVFYEGEWRTGKIETFDSGKCNGWSSSFNLKKSAQVCVSFPISTDSSSFRFKKYWFNLNNANETKKPAPKKPLFQNKRSELPQPKIKICRVNVAGEENCEWKFFNNIDEVVLFLKSQGVHASRGAANNALKGTTKSSSGYWIRHVEKNEEKVFATQNRKRFRFKNKEHQEKVFAQNKWSKRRRHPWSSGVPKHGEDIKENLEFTEGSKIRLASIQNFGYLNGLEGSILEKNFVPGKHKVLLENGMTIYVEEQTLLKFATKQNEFKRKFSNSFSSLTSERPKKKAKFNDDITMPLKKKQKIPFFPSPPSDSSSPLLPSDREMELSEMELPSDSDIDDSDIPLRPQGSRLPRRRAPRRRRRPLPPLDTRMSNKNTQEHMKSLEEKLKKNVKEILKLEQAYGNLLETNQVVENAKNEEMQEMEENEEKMEKKINKLQKEMKLIKKQYEKRIKNAQMSKKKDAKKLKSQKEMTKRKIKTMSAKFKKEIKDLKEQKEEFENDNEELEEKLQNKEDELIKLGSKKGAEIRTIAERISNDVKNVNLDREVTCVICLDLPKVFAYIPCGHKAVCGICAVQTSNCPLCQTKSEGKLRIWD